MLTISSSGSFKNTESFLKSMQRLNIISILNSCGDAGVQALSMATPVDSGQAASSWYYKVGGRNGKYNITWYNSDVENGFPVAIMLQYGYGTGTGGFVQGEDYINPAIRPIFNQIADKAWKAVTSA